MAIDFPNSPTLNQQYTVGDRSWTWNGTFWQVTGTTSTFTASDTAPSGPSIGDFWFESDTGKTFVYYDDVWVEVGSASGSIDAGNLAGSTLASSVVNSSLTNVTSSGLTVRTASTQDGVALAGRAGGSSTYEVTLTPTTLTADRTLTLPNVSGTVVTTGNLTDITSTGTLSSLAVTGDITRGGVSLPRGIMAYTSSTTSDTSVTTEEVEYTLTWTAVANRYYKITVFEPDTGISGVGAGTCFWRLRQTNISGTILQSAYNWVPSSAVDTVSQIVYIGTFSAGSQTVVATAAATGGVTIQLNRGTGKIGYAVVEDIGAV